MMAWSPCKMAITAAPSLSARSKISPSTRSTLQVQAHSRYTAAKNGARLMSCRLGMARDLAKTCLDVDDPDISLPREPD